MSCRHRWRRSTERSHPRPIGRSAAPIRPRKARAACTSSRHRRCGAARSTSAARHPVRRFRCTTRRVPHRAGSCPSAPRSETTGHPVTPRVRDRNCAPARPHRDRRSALPPRRTVIATGGEHDVVVHILAWSNARIPRGPQSALRRDRQAWDASESTVRHRVLRFRRHRDAAAVAVRAHPQQAVQPAVRAAGR